MSKYLKIKNGRGLYLNSDEEYQYINTINADDLVRMFTLIMESEEFNFDEYDKNLLHNAADRIIYEKITLKISNLIQNKEQVISDVNSEYQDLVEKYNLANID